MDSTTDRSNQLEKVNDAKQGVGRSYYECTFCKRGFTNAQALGGHMNIHRKDKAKAKKLNESSSISHKDHMGSRYFAPISSEKAYCDRAFGAHMDYQMHFPASNPSFWYHPSDFTTDSKFSSGRGECVEENLSLQIGSSLMEDCKEKGEKKNWKENEVDLELRLGHNP